MAEEIEEVEERGSRNGVERSALLLLSLGKELSAKVLAHLNPREVQQIANAMAQLENVRHQDIKEALQAFMDEQGEEALGVDPSEFAQSLISEALGESAGQSMDVSMLADQIKGLEALKWMHPSSIANMLKNEHPQVIAVILSYFEPDIAAQVLEGIPERFQAEVIYRIATLTTVQPRALFDLNDVIQNQASGDGGKLVVVGGEKKAAEILNLIGGGKDTKILDEIATEHEDISKAIQDKMFVFEDLIELDDRAMQTVASEVPMDVLKVALKGADQKLIDKFLNNMSKRQAEMLREEIEMMGPVKLSDVEDAQRQVIQTVRRLADEEKIMMPGAGEEFV
ncbi:flagellar motor switch protein FliG [Galenea microaerophila]